MKKLYLIVFASLLFVISNSAFASFENQWFKNYSETQNWINFDCSNQCFIILWKMGTNDYIKINWNINWSWWIGYWFANWDKLVPWNWIEISWSQNINQKYLLKELNFYSQLPQDIPTIVFIQWNVAWNSVNIEFWQLWLWESIANWFSEALKYREYNPRTINFLEWPTWNGKYINEIFFWWIFFLVLISLWIYFLIWKQSKIPLYFWIWVLVFFWIFFDFFSTVNEYRIYNDVTSATNIMQNGRVGKTSDFYQFLEFVKQNIPKGNKWVFIAPYPFDFEWKYHIYPDVKFDSIDKVKYIITYSPYWPNNPFNFKDPVYDSWTLNWDKYKLEVVKEIKYSDTAKIYIIK